MSGLTLLCVLDFGIQWTVYTVSAYWRTEKFFEITGSYTFIVLTYLGYKWSIKNVRQKIQAGMVMAWAIRYGFYVLMKILNDGKDKRFDEVKRKPGLFFLAWTLQGTWVFVTLIPTLVMMTKDDDQPLTDQDYIGYGIWTIGSFVEAFADYQRTIFINDPDNEGKFITTGLWSLSRHPNFFGEALSWFGLYISASTVFGGLEMYFILCPIFNLMLISRVRGIPHIEDERRKDWGNDPEYDAYVRRTAMLVPFIW